KIVYLLAVDCCKGSKIIRTFLLSLIPTQSTRKNLEAWFRRVVGICDFFVISTDLIRPGCTQNCPVEHIGGWKQTPFAIS
ncbi:hypothetical protein PFISCL1PPCAC_28771, partial [Pristionchus fissidentatus]